MFRWTFLLLLVFGLLSCNRQESSYSITTLAIGSCSREYSENQLWNEINTTEPKVFIWLGDNIYGDSPDMSVLREKYDQQKSHPGYQELLSKSTIIGTWDDHDYGLNDGGKEFSMKKESKVEFMRFLDISEDHPINDHEGVYHSYDFKSEDKLIKILLLDTRYFRDPLIPDTITEARYTSNPSGDILGNEQWNWLNKELEQSKADFHIVVSSIQYLSDEHGYEKWANFPLAKKRMMGLIEKYPNKEILIVSGDRHISEFSRLSSENLSYPLYDFTCSGLTHSWGDARDEANRFRVGPLIKVPNFGLINIDWEKKEVILDVIAAENELVSTITIPYPNL